MQRVVAAGFEAALAAGDGRNLEISISSFSLTSRSILPEK
jgi:hypothetical protein